ncbi:uncharacterized protein LOC114930805 [Nylanderia fulva]|uniref:uncharacterized protein LOC114930805 n=1 Tax=Nylanderia fulva TaxID=613905 RepID=UPI0010FAE3AF|nr:uncharacterized protein LOC114930805 [Nylanderia fulva]
MKLLSRIFKTSEQDVTKPLVNFEEWVNIYKKISKLFLRIFHFSKKQIKQILQVKLNDLRTRTLFKVNNILNSTFENIKLSIEKAKKEGKKINECYNYAKHNLETRKDNTIAELETYIQYGNKTMEAPLKNVANNIKVIKTLLTKLNAIIPKCYSSNYIKMQSCIAMNLARTKLSLKDIDSLSLCLCVVLKRADDNNWLALKRAVDCRLLKLKSLSPLDDRLCRGVTWSPGGVYSEVSPSDGDV